MDLIPFGAIEQADRTIAWPPDGAFVMKVLGLREVLDSTLTVRLPGDETIRVVSLPALAILKLRAWSERRLTEPGKDAHDPPTILRNYRDAGNHKRLYGEAAHLLEHPAFDYEQAGAWLVGHDMACLLPRGQRQGVADLLNRESDPTGTAWLAGDMPMDSNHALSLIQSLTTGFTENIGALGEGPCGPS